MKDNVESDPFEEFEFKPLNEGLGFHRAQSAKTPMPIAKTPVAAKPTALPKVNALLNTPLLKTALPRDKKSAIATTGASDKTMQALYKNPWDFKEKTQELDKLDISESPMAQAPPKFEKKQTQAKAQEKTKTRSIAPNFAAITLDALLVAAGFLTCLIVLLMITQVDLVASFSTGSDNIVLGGSLLGLFVALCWMYMVLHRVALGATTGEWVFDMQLGTRDQIGTMSYVGKVVLRATLVVLSGVIFVPLASMLMGRDLLGELLGLELYPTIRSGT
jgi:hypothetical protein